MRHAALLVPLVLILAGASACGDDDDPAKGSSPVGGWKGSGLYACFHTDGRFASGDHINEVSTPSGSWTQDGKITLPKYPSEHMTWTINADKNLVLALPASCTQDCGPYLLTPDNSLPCFK